MSDTQRIQQAINSGDFNTLRDCCMDITLAMNSGSFSNYLLYVFLEHYRFDESRIPPEAYAEFSRMIIEAVNRNIESSKTRVNNLESALIEINKSQTLMYVVTAELCNNDIISEERAKYMGNIITEINPCQADIKTPAFLLMIGNKETSFSDAKRAVQEVNSRHYVKGSILKKQNKKDNDRNLERRSFLESVKSEKGVCNFLLKHINEGTYFKKNKDIAKIFAKKFAEIFHNICEQQKQKNGQEQRFDLNNLDDLIQISRISIIETNNYFEENRDKNVSKMTRAFNRAVNSFEMKLQDCKTYADRLVINENELYRKKNGANYRKDYKIRLASILSEKNGVDNFVNNKHKVEHNFQDYETLKKNNENFKYQSLIGKAISDLFNKLFHFLSSKSKLNESSRKLKEKSYHYMNNNNFTQPQPQPQPHPPANQNVQTQTDTFNSLNNASNNFNNTIPLAKLNA